MKVNGKLSGSEKKLSGLVSDKQRALKTFDAAYGDALRFVQACFKMAGFDTRALKNLRPYYLRRRLSARARKAREARATAAADGAKPVPEEAPAATPETDRRVPIPEPMVQWLERSRLFGT